MTAYNGELISRTNVTQRTIEQLDSLIVSYDFIPLETGDNSLLSNITDIRYHDRKFFVTSSGAGSSSEILVFDSLGKYLNRIAELAVVLMNISGYRLGTSILNSNKSSL